MNLFKKAFNEWNKNFLQNLKKGYISLTVNQIFAKNAKQCIYCMPNNLLPYEHDGTCFLCELNATK